MSMMQWTWCVSESTMHSGHFLLTSRFSLSQIFRGGSPTQAALREAPLFPNAICITGLNLGMLLELATMPLDGANLQDAKTIAKEAVRSSLNSIGLLEDIAASVDRTLTDDAESEEL